MVKQDRGQQAQRPFPTKFREDEVSLVFRHIKDNFKVKCLSASMPAPTKDNAVGVRVLPGRAFLVPETFSIKVGSRTKKMVVEVTEDYRHVYAGYTSPIIKISEALKNPRSKQALIRAVRCALKEDLGREEFSIEVDKKRNVFLVTLDRHNIGLIDEYLNITLGKKGYRVLIKPIIKESSC